MPLPSFDPADYTSQLSDKLESFKKAFTKFGLPEPMVFASTPLHYRMRAEFRMWHQDERVDYAMFDSDRILSNLSSLKNSLQPTAKHLHASCPACEKAPAGLYCETLKRRLFQINFLATLSGDLLAYADLPSPTR
jgi:tRNA (uracil-5-)-methyltransferase